MPTPLRHFLSRAPRPSKVVAIDGDGEPTTIAIGTGRARYADAERAVPSGTVRLEARDAHGAVLRAMDLPDQGGADDAGDAPRAPRSSGAIVAQTTPLELARIILDATDRGAERHAAAYEASMGHLVALVHEVQSQHAATLRRLDSMEAAWSKLMRAVPAATEAEPDALAMLAPLLMQTLGGAAPSPNGKAKSDGQ